MRCSVLTPLVLALLWWAGGCDSAPPPTVTTSFDATKIGGAKKDAFLASEPDLGPANGRTVEEIWEAYSIQGVRVGFAATRISRAFEAGRELVQTRSVTRTALQRGGQSIRQEVVLASWDTPEGELVRFETQTTSGAGDVLSRGTVMNGKLRIDTTTAGRTQSQEIPWPAGWGGLFAPDQALRRQPPLPGEKRTLTSFLPLVNVAGQTNLEALDYEPVELPSGKVRLLKVRSTVAIGGQPIQTLLWIDERGQTLKSLTPSIGLASVRTTKADALQQPAAGAFDLQTRSSVPLQGNQKLSSQTRRAVYRARLSEGQIDGLFAAGPSQQIRPIDERTAEITVVAVRPAADGVAASAPSAGSPQHTSSGPTDADRSPSSVVQSDDPLIQELAAGIAPAETDPWKVACAMEQFVRGLVHHRGALQVFATAAEVARSREGDCTEHAVLLAALCRARQIPARVAFGLVYVPATNSFEYHMWNEIWIAGRWVPMDATLGQGGIGADHLKLGDSSLASGSPLADLISVIQVFGRLELELVKAE